jgi:integrating conjugative element protein (TIGR03749 family)
MVALTRYAAQSLYAPRRLVPATAGVRPLPVAALPVEGLYRGGRIQMTPIGAWRSGSLYLTAVRATNRSERAQDLDLQELRGHWLAATAQHTRLLGAGSDSDTTTLYLVCDRPFEACR